MAIKLNGMPTKRDSGYFRKWYAKNRERIRSKRSTSAYRERASIYARQYYQKKLKNMNALKISDPQLFDKISSSAKAIAKQRMRVYRQKPEVRDRLSRYYKIYQEAVRRDPCKYAASLKRAREYRQKLLERDPDYFRRHAAARKARLAKNK
jgi:hypothetical protein